jgi:hypothetical protein
MFYAASRTLLKQVRGVVVLVATMTRDVVGQNCGLMRPRGVRWTRSIVDILGMYR